MGIRHKDGLEKTVGHLSDAGNAARFARHHRGSLLHCEGAGWLYFTGKRWEPAKGLVTKLGKDTVSQIYKEAGTHADDERRAKVAGWALRSESEQRIKSMISLAECELPISADQLDADPWLLNCANGTLDLKTGELRDHNPDDLITKLAPVEYDLNASSDLWESVVEHALPAEAVRDYFQRLVGYTLSGVTGEDVFVLIHGPTRTSKGTIQEAIATMLGDYAVTSELDLLAQKARAGAPRPELTRLRGARMCSIYETSHHMRLSASLVKSLAGSDPITARELYRSPITFKPEATLWVATNHQPKAPPDDDALWERIRLLPFGVQLSESERDRSVRSELQDPSHGAAILAWAVLGCLMWQVEGLQQPDIVRTAGKAYRASQDATARFFEEVCVFGPNCWVQTSKLRDEYDSWCREESETALGGAALSAKLREQGCEPQKISRRGGRGWKGIGIRGDHLKVVKRLKAGQP